MIHSIRGTKNYLLKKLAVITRKFSLRGSNRILRFLYSPDRRQEDYFETIIDYDHDLLFHINTSNFLEWKVFFFGYYEPGIVKLIKSLLEPGARAIDVGANVGSHTLIMASEVGKNGRVLAVEPFPPMYERLKRNIELNEMANVKLVDKILLNENRSNVKLRVPRSDTANQGTASTVKSEAKELNDTIEVGWCKTR